MYSYCDCVCVCVCVCVCLYVCDSITPNWGVFDEFALRFIRPFDPFDSTVVYKHRVYFVCVFESMNTKLRCFRLVCFALHSFLLMYGHHLYLFVFRSLFLSPSRLIPPPQHSLRYIYICQRGGGNCQTYKWRHIPIKTPGFRMSIYTSTSTIEL